MTRGLSKITGLLALTVSAITVTGAVMAQNAKVSNATVAFLMPDQASTRYEEHDYPGFKAEMEKLCPTCKVLYQNADANVARQQQQFNSAISQGAKIIVMDPVDSDCCGVARQAGAGSGHQGYCVRSACARRQGGFLRLLR